MDRYEFDKRLLKDPASSQGKSEKTQDPLIHRYGKRKFIVDEIKNEARRQRCTLEFSGQRLDETRNSLNKTVSQYYKYLKSNDVSTHKRRPTNRPTNNSTTAASDNTTAATATV